jgi:hypothetical protein
VNRSVFLRRPPLRPRAHHRAPLAFLSNRVKLQQIRRGSVWRLLQQVRKRQCYLHHTTLRLEPYPGLDWTELQHSILCRIRLLRTLLLMLFFPSSTQLTIPACVDRCTQCSHNNDEHDAHTNDIAGPNADRPLEQMHKNCQGHLRRLLQQVCEREQYHHRSAVCLEPRPRFFRSEL